MDIKIDFNPEDVAAKLKEAIMTSTFEEIFKNAVKTEIDNLTKTCLEDSRY